MLDSLNCRVPAVGGLFSFLVGPENVCHLNYFSTPLKLLHIQRGVLFKARVGTRGSGTDGPLSRLYSGWGML